MVKYIFKNLLIIFTLIVLVSCANRGTPSGGTKDNDPPEIVRSVPENFSTNFDASEIRIYFDEYIKINDVQRQLIISPPMDPQPDITPLGSASKYIKIKILDTLQPNTTMLLILGKVLLIIMKGILIHITNMCFLQDSYIDSLSVQGQISDAMNRKPDNFVSVMLYEMDSTYTDSIVYKEKPKYITNTLDSLKIFKLDNLKAGNYMMVAVKDENSNYTFQQKTDKIGFYKTPITVPTDSTYAIKMFKEELDFKATRPFQAAGQKIGFGYEGDYKDMRIRNP